MITGQLRSKIDKLWEQFWTGGVTNPLTVIEQISFLMFARLLICERVPKKNNGHARIRANHSPVDANRGFFCLRFLQNPKRQRGTSPSNEHLQSIREGRDADYQQALRGYRVFPRPT